MRRGANFIKFGELDNRRSSNAAVPVDAPPNIIKALSDKFLTVTSFGSVGAITRAPISVTRSVRKRVYCSSSAWKKWLQSHARKIAISGTATADTMKFYDGLPPSATTSLHAILLTASRANWSIGMER